MGLIRKEDLHESLLNSLSNPNLLINGDFQVWQRGEVFTTTENGLMLYTADRWHFWNDNRAYPQRSKVEKYNGHFKFTSVGNDWLRQHIEADLSGVPLTLSISVKGSAGSTIMLRMDDAKSPTDQSITNVVNKTYSCTGGYDTFVLNIPAFNYSKFPTVLIRSKSIDVFEIEWVKLEYGSLATPFIPRLFAEELALCKRYYEVSNKHCYISGVKNHQGYLVEYKYDVEKRVQPTIVCGNASNQGQMYLFIPNNSKLVTPNSIVPDTKKVRIIFPMEDNNGLTDGNTCGAIGWIKADAEIY